ncbi:MAG TPA: MgtC/SapB family protein [Rhizomicrobium sp.]|nr:MgtC/SapB family protein [Rhizomicrobium sp.]
MPLQPTWQDLAIRLVLATASGIIIGLNRERRHRPAGLRTTTLVSLAAAVAMIQVNLLLPQGGKASDSMVVLDLMRLPLGILSGMGFIGAGAIIRRGDGVSGVTTAATLWFVTVMGLCFGGGQLSLGVAALVLAIFVLWGLKWFERRSSQDYRATLTLTALAGSISSEDLHASLCAEGFHISSCNTSWRRQSAERRWTYELHWREKGEPSDAPPLAQRLSAHPGVISLQWKR